MNEMESGLPRPELEERLTAWLLGEVSAAEAADLERQVRENRELAAVYAELKGTVERLRAVAGAAAPGADQSAVQRRLSEPRRTALLTRLGQSSRLGRGIKACHRNRLLWVVPVSMAACFVALLSLVLFQSLEAPQRLAETMDAPLFAKTERTDAVGKELQRDGGDAFALSLRRESLTSEEFAQGTPRSGMVQVGRGLQDEQALKRNQSEANIVLPSIETSRGRQAIRYFSESRSASPNGPEPLDPLTAGAPFTPARPASKAKPPAAEGFDFYAPGQGVGGGFGGGGIGGGGARAAGGARSDGAHLYAAPQLYGGYGMGAQEPQATPFQSPDGPSQSAPAERGGEALSFRRRLSEAESSKWGMIPPSGGVEAAGPVEESLAPAAQNAAPTRPDRDLASGMTPELSRRYGLAAKPEGPPHPAPAPSEMPAPRSLAPRQAGQSPPSVSATISAPRAKGTAPQGAPQAEWEKLNGDVEFPRERSLQRSEDESAPSQVLSLGSVVGRSAQAEELPRSESINGSFGDQLRQNERFSLNEAVKKGPMLGDEPILGQWFDRSAADRQPPRVEMVTPKSDLSAMTPEAEPLRFDGAIKLQQAPEELERLEAKMARLQPGKVLSEMQQRQSAPEEALEQAKQSIDAPATGYPLQTQESELRRGESRRRGIQNAAPQSAPARSDKLSILKKVEIIDREAAVKVVESLIERDLDSKEATNPVPLPVPQPEVTTADNPFSTFSLNVTDVSFKTAAASLEQGLLPHPATIRAEEWINAFDYHDPEPPPGAPVTFHWETAHYPFAHDRDILRFSLKTAAEGRERGRPLNLTLLLDNSGSMERADRVAILHQALGVLAEQLQPQDRVSVVAFARTPRLWVDAMPGGQPEALLERVTSLNPEGGTHLEGALEAGYATAARHFLPQGNNRVILLTDGAANLGNVDPELLKAKVESNRKKGIALDCFGIGWEGYNDELMEVLARNGDGRYGFLNSVEDASVEFADQLAGALQTAAADVKVQVEFNPQRVAAYRQIGYARHQLKKEQFRDNTVDAAELGAAEAGNALYVIQVRPGGSGPIGTVRVRYRVPATGRYDEREWLVPFQRDVSNLGAAAPSMRLAAVAGSFAERLAQNPYADDVSLDELLSYLNRVPEAYPYDERPEQLVWMIRQAQSIGGR